MNWDQSLKPLLVIVLHLKIKCCYDRILLPAWEGHFDFILAHADLERGMWNIGQRFPARDPQGSFTRDAVGPCAGPSQTPAWHKGAVNKHCSKDTMERKNAGEHLLQGVLFPPSSVLAPVPKGIASPQTPFSRSEFTAEMGSLNFSLGNWVHRAGEFCTQNHQPEKKWAKQALGPQAPIYADRAVSGTQPSRPWAISWLCSASPSSASVLRSAILNPKCASLITIINRLLNEAANTVNGIFNDTS